ncbi:hypothetical protein KXQ82_18330 [Mucilaginibacter sp. HMF5004]|uniref:hypothetical protein n=1 Tax=Mucilaginibacter rivuli TaxID=2857527 RepID=UPI001C5FDE5B|nr:hypothetical protein [Mucilaginibacter rivuli]MBW4891688.1 hypothetical protein [Mucilaginibacter rivuli]
MKKIKYIYIVAVLFSIANVFTGCMKDRANLYTGPTVVEFSPITGSVKKSVTTGSAVLVQLVGPQVSTPTEVNYEIATTSTGVMGTDYSISGTVGKATIPANSSSATITITPLATFPATGSKTVVLTLLGNSSVPANPNYKTFTLTITQ